MIVSQLLAALLLVGGGTVVLLRNLPGRQDLRARLRTLDGLQPPSRRQQRRAVVAGIGIAAIPAIPILLLVGGAPPLVPVIAAVVLVPMLLTIGLELYAALRRSGMPPRVPLMMEWQRRLASTLVARVTAPLPAAPLRQRKPRQRRSPPSLTSAGTGRRLLVVPPGRPAMRLWEISEIYLGSRHRYRNVLALNRGRRSPHGEVITEDSRIGPGWTLIMPRDAIGVGLVDLPGDPRLPMPSGATPHTVRGAAPSVALSEINEDSRAVASNQPVTVEKQRDADAPASRPRVTAQETDDTRREADDTARSAQPTAGRTVADPPRPEADEPETAAIPIVTSEPPRATAPAGTARPAAGAPAAEARPAVAGATTGTAEPVPATEPAGGGAEPVGGVQPASPDDGAAAAVVDDTPLDHPPADLPWDLVHAQLLADGIRAALATRRYQLEHDRPVGAGVRPLDPAAASVQAAAELGADQAGAEVLDRALRTLAAGGTVPPVVAARLLPEQLELSLSNPAPIAPEPFVADEGGRRWRVRRDRFPNPITGASAYPGLVSVGRDRVGWVLVDLLSAGGVVSIVGDPRAGRLVATAMALELLTKRWSDEVRVSMVGFGLPLERLDSRLRCVDRLDEVLDDVARRVVGDSSAVPEFLVLATPPAPPHYDVLRHLAEQRHRAPLGVLVVGGTPHDRWRFELQNDGVLRCPDLNLVVGAQALSVQTAQALGRLVEAESGSVLDDPLSQEPAPAPELPREVNTSPEIVVRLFGGPRLDSPRGSLDADPLTVEIIAFLALMGTATAQEVAAAVFPFGTADAELRTALKAVAETLATAPSGNPGLLEHSDGRLRLTDDVQADWHLFVALCKAGREPAALELLSGGPSAERPGMHHGAQYGWLAGIPLRRLLPGYITDMAHTLVRARLAAGRPDLAAVAASAGLRAQPFSQVLRDDLDAAMRAMRSDNLVAGGAS
ncbi:MAG TPA: hypothetical protein VD813_15280 [Pseudonocardia sp.]|nr:hypothetical protein [Pseudonocardia sp.]